jgi:hypothetical protein
VDPNPVLDVTAQSATDVAQEITPVIATPSPPLQPPLADAAPSSSVQEIAPLLTRKDTGSANDPCTPTVSAITATASKLQIRDFISLPS